MKKSFTKKGFTVLYAVIIISIITAIGSGVFSLSTKQTQLSTVTSDSSTARSATDRAIECLMYNDIVSGAIADVGDMITCEGSTFTLASSTRSGFDLDATVTHSDGTCAGISFDSDYNGDTRIYSRGFNRCSASGPISGDPFLREHVYEVVYEGGSEFARQEVFGETDTTQTTDLIVYGDLLIAADTLSDIVIYSLADPANPLKIGDYAMGSKRIEEIGVFDGYLYVAADNVYILDISNPANPTLVGQTSGLVMSSAIYKLGDYLYVGNIHHGFYTFDVSDLANPVQIDRYDPTNISTERIFVSGDYAYVCGLQSDFVILDISTPGSPVELGTYSGTSDCRFADGDMVKIGDYILVPWSAYGIYVLDVSDPNAISLVTSFIPPSVKEGQLTSSGSTQDLALDGDLLYVSALATFYTYDVSDPANPQLLYESNTYAVGTQNTAVSLYGGNAYLADTGGGILHYGPLDEVITTYSDK